MMKNCKKGVSLLLTLSVLLSMVCLGTFSSSAVKTEHSKYVPGADVNTYKYYFAMPGSWLNDSTKDNNDAAGCYWWDATDSPGDRFDNGWPGYECDKETGEANVPNLYSIQVPQDADVIVWNNYLDGGTDASKPVFYNAKQISNKNVENYAWGDSPTYSDKLWTLVYKTAADQLGLDIAEYDIKDRIDDINEAAMDDPEAIDFTEVFGDKYGKNFYVDEEINEGLAMRFENMVYVVDLEKVTIDYTIVPEGKLQYGGEFYFYYGNGEYGMWPTKELAKEHEGADYFEQDADGNYTKANKYGVVLNEDGQVVVGSFTGSYWSDKPYVTPDYPTVSPDYPIVSPDSPKIYFEVPTFWGNNYQDIRIYLYEVGGDPIIKWNSKKGKMTDEGGGIMSFDMSMYPMSDSKNYACIFLTNTEAQTCDLLIGNPCLGDTAYCTGERDKVENTEDSYKKSYRVKWKKADPTRWGVPLAITSIGNIVGEALLPGQTKYNLFLTFLTDKGRHGVDNAIKFNGKTQQKTIDDTAKALGLSINDIKRAIMESGRTDLDWQEKNSPLYIISKPPTSVKINRTTLGLGMGEKYGLVKTVLPSDADQSVTWISSDSKVAAVDSNGVVTGRIPGTATVVFYTNNGLAASCTVTVKTAPSSIKINPESLTMGNGESYTISESTDSGSYANAANLKWSSSNTNIVTVSKQAGTNKATLKAVGTGTAYITIQTYNGRTAACKVTVKPAPSSIKINPESLTMGNGESYTVSESTDSGSYANAANLKWSSSDTKIVTVSKQAGTNKATLKAVGTGSAYIIINTYNGRTAVCKVTVKPAPSSVKTDPASVTLGKGESYTVSETTNSGSYANAANLKWSSSNTKVATVTKGSGNKATVKAVGTGTAYVKITLYNGKTAQCKVTVKPAPTSVRLSNTSLTLKKGQTYTISESTNSGSYANAANLKWSSTNTKVATVTKGSANKATIKAVGKGTAYIKITLYNGKTAQCKVTVQ
ncbi:MAG: Ig-like domain-containing protein [Ruminococcus sp.]|nr:Ig-like domain-containing protein [Ruminococcus sp.]